MAGNLYDPIQDGGTEIITPESLPVSTEVVTIDADGQLDTLPLGSANGLAILDGAGLIGDSFIPASIARDAEVTAAVAAAVAALINSAPGTLDTLDELAAALGDDPNFATTISALIGTKVAKSLYDANTILAANSDDTPAAITVGEQTLVGRITGGNIAALTASQVKTLLGLVIGTDVQAYDAQLASLAALAYSGNGGKFVRVNAGATDFELATVTETVGGSTGVADNRILRSDGTGGATAQNSPVEILDSGLIQAASGDTLIGAGGNIRMQVSAAGSIQVVDLEPFADANRDIGSGSKRFRDGYLSRNLTAAGVVLATGGDTTVGQLQCGSSGFGLAKSGSNDLVLVCSFGAQAAIKHVTGLQIQSGMGFQWSSNTSLPASSPDTELIRSAAGSVQARGASSAMGTFYGIHRHASYTVGTLPTAGTAGRSVYASNARKSGEGAAAGTGCMVWDDGTNWRTFYDNTVAAA